jgi:hypothetical protein
LSFFISEGELVLGFACVPITLCMLRISFGYVAPCKKLGSLSI